MNPYSVLIAGVTPDDAQVAVCSAADEWGAEFEPVAMGGRLRLPVLHGLRRGLVSAAVAIEAQGEGSRVELQPEASEQALNTPAFCLVLVAGVGAVLTVLWPLYPPLLPFAPLGAVLAIAGWFQISRLAKRGPEDFLRQVEVHAARHLDDRGLQGSGGEGPDSRGNF